MKRLCSPLCLIPVSSLLLLISLWLILRSPVIVTAEGLTSPDLPGTISGHVVDRNGMPIAGVRVEAMTQPTGYASDYAISDENGVYKILNVGAGIYRVRFTARDWHYAAQFYAGAKILIWLKRLPWLRMRPLVGLILS